MKKKNAQTINWRKADVVMRYKSRKLQQPKKKIGDGVLAPAMSIIPCNILSDMPFKDAMKSLKNFLIKENTEINLKSRDFVLERGFNDHNMSSPKKKNIIFITPRGCKAGSPLL